MPLLHISLDQRDTNRADNVWNITLSHTIAEQVITLREVFINTVAVGAGATQAIIPITSPVTSGATGKTFLLVKLEQGRSTCLAHRQIVSNVRGGAWLPIPCDYSASRAETQHYRCNESLLLDKDGIPSEIVVEVWADEDVNHQTYPTFGTAADNISRIDLVFEYENSEKASDAN